MAGELRDGLEKAGVAGWKRGKGGGGSSAAWKTDARVRREDVEGIPGQDRAYSAVIQIERGGFRFKRSRRVFDRAFLDGGAGGPGW